MASFSLPKTKQNKFGLIRQPAQQAAKLKSNIFKDEDEDLDEPEERPTAPSAEQPKKYRPSFSADFEAPESSIDKQIRESAIQEDSSIFDYDGVYDKMKEAETLARTGFSSQQSRKPRYVGSMLKQAALRSIEDDVIKSRKVMRETEESLKKEGLSKDSLEVFVTDSWREKQEELRRQKEEEAERARQSEQRKDYVGFHRNLLDLRTRTAAARDLNLDVVESVVKEKEEPLETSAESHSNENPTLKGGLNVMIDRKAIEERRQREKRQAEEARRQFEEEQRKKKAQEERELEEKKLALKRSTDDSAISDAKRRYEERKKLRLASK